MDLSANGCLIPSSLAVTSLEQKNGKPQQIVLTGRPELDREHLQLRENSFFWSRPSLFHYEGKKKMSRILEALRRSEKKQTKPSLALRENEQLGQQLSASPGKHPVGFEDVKRVRWPMDSEKRIVAWADPQAIGAEKFRVLRYRLQHLRMARALSKCWRR